MATDPTKAVTRAASGTAIMSPGAVSPGSMPIASPQTSYSVTGSSTVAVSLAIKRVRLAIVSPVSVAIVVASLLAFRRGVTLSTVELPSIKTEETTKSQTKLLDKYNSYTGNAAAALTKPIEVFVTMALQLVLLRFAARVFLKPELAWRMDKFAAIAAWALLYLLLNGFNSLNVQLRTDRIIPVIDASDLTYTEAVDTNASVSSAATTNSTFVVPEATPGNLITNTILRTAVAPRVWLKPDPTCTIQPVDEEVQDDGVEYGFPIRAWLGKMQAAAPPARTLTIPLNSTTTADPKQLPMDASRAATLFLAGVRQADNFMLWFGGAGLNDSTAADNLTPSQSAILDDKGYVVSQAQIYGLLPPDSSSSEASKREWFLREAPQILVRAFAEKKVDLGTTVTTQNNDTESGLTMAFSHVDFTPTIGFDAVTFDAAVNDKGYTTAIDADGVTRYFNWYSPQIGESACGPASICNVQKTKYGTVNEAVYDFPSQIQAAAVCINTNGTEESSFRFVVDGRDGRTGRYPDCNRTSTTSMLTISIAKRIVADAVVEQATSRTRNATILTPDTVDALTYPVLVNARKIYSFTVGQLSWKTEDLAKAFNAVCNVKTANKCQGLQFPLTSSGRPREVLVASADALPVGKLGQVESVAGLNKYTPLVILHEPSRPAVRTRNFVSKFNLAAGDVLLPHNLGSKFKPDKSTDPCSAVVENRQNNLLTNHIYMENGLQPAYTSALFWLFQNGVVKQVINATAKSSDAKTLQFNANVQVSALVASIPATNVWLSLVGCFLLLAGVLATITYSGQLLGDESEKENGASKLPNGELSTTAGVTQVSDPRVVARVMLDDARFPPLFLDRHIVETSTTNNVGITDAAKFEIASMTLEGEDTCGAKQIVLANPINAGLP